MRYAQRVEGKKEENRILRTVKLFGLVEIAHLVMT
jgi:hypothetical protein